MVELVEAGMLGLLGEELLMAVLQVNDDLTKTLEAEPTGAALPQPEPILAGFSAPPTAGQQAASPPGGARGGDLLGLSDGPLSPGDEEELQRRPKGRGAPLGASPLARPASHFIEAPTVPVALPPPPGSATAAIPVAATAAAADATATATDATAPAPAPGFDVFASSPDLSNPATLGSTTGAAAVPQASSAVAEAPLDSTPELGFAASANPFAVAGGYVAPSSAALLATPGAVTPPAVSGAVPPPETTQDPLLPPPLTTQDPFASLAPLG